MGGVQLSEYQLPMDEAIEMFDRLDAQIDQKKRNKKRLAAGIGVVGVVIIAGVSLYSGIALEDLWLVWIFGGLFVLMLSALLGLLPAQKLQQQDDMLEFVRDLCARLAPDVHPKAQLRFSVDMRGHRLSEKVVWSGRSMHGNAKYRYLDRWLKLQVRLADRSALTVRRRVMTKTRKGAVMKQVCKLTLKLRPDPRVYDVALVRDRLAHEERMVVSPAGQNSEVRLKLDRLNEGFSVPEVHDQLRAMLEALSSCRHRAS